MSGRVRLYGVAASLCVALDCFGKTGGELQLPYWAWAALGVWWCFAALEILVSGVRAS